MKFGYVGVGLMGLPMTARLIACGHAVRAFDISAARMTQATQAGAELASSAADATKGVDAVLLNLPTDHAVEEAVFGESGVASALTASQRLVDFSTIQVASGSRFAAELIRRTGVVWLDAPVSGGPVACESGSLTVMAGGVAADIAALDPLWRAVAGRFSHMGATGAGLAAKMINQLIVGCGNAVMAEACALAVSAGIDPAQIPKCLAGGHADSELLRQVFPRMATRDFAPRGYARQLLKDLEAVITYSGSLKSPAPMTSQALSLYRMLVRQGFAELDTSAIVRLYDNQQSEET